MKKTYFISILLMILLCFVFTGNTFAIISDDITDSEYIYSLGETYSFWIGQEYVCEGIIKNYPEYKSEVNFYRSKFNNKFKTSIDNIEKQIIDIYGEQEFNDSMNEIKTALYKNIETQYKIIDEQGIASTVNTLEKRLKGEMIPEDIFRNLLIYNNRYKEFPHKEFIDGYTKRYYTKNSKKARDLNIMLKMPYSWKEMEAERPHIVKEFKSENGKGFETFMLIVFKNKELENVSEALKEMKDKNITFTQKELNNIFNQYIPAGGNYIHGEIITIETLPAIKLRSEISRSRMGFDFLMETVSYNIFYKDYLIQLQLGTGSNNKIAEVLDSEEYKIENSKKQFEKFEPLFQIIANDIVINNVWEY